MPDENKPENGQEKEVALTPYQEATGMVRTFAMKLVGDERAMQFATTMSIMARQNPRFAQATQESVVTAMMACVQLDLMPNTPEQHAFLIPYKSQQGVQIQFQLGYRGLLKLAQRSDQIKSIAAELVFEGDKFKVKLGTNRQLIHEPNFDVDRTDYGKVTHAYVTAVLHNGEKVFEVMTRKELDKIQTSAKARSTDAPWNTWPEAMAKKTVIKRAAKLLPASSEDDRLIRAAQFDSWAEANKLKLKDNVIIEGEGSFEETDEERRERMQKASQDRKEAMGSDATPVQTPGQK